MSEVCRPLRRLFLLALVLVGTSGLSQTVPMTTVQDTVYRADGSPAQGTLIISWPGFTTSGGEAIAAGTTNVNLGTGGALAVSLTPNANATPVNTVYTVVYQLNDGTVKTEYWMVPTTSPATLGEVRTTLGATSSVAQMATQQFVNSALAAKANDSSVVHISGTEAISGPKQFSVSPSMPTPSQPSDAANKAYVDSAVQNAGSGSYLSTSGGTLTGPLTLSGDPMSANQASTKHYVDIWSSVKADLIGGLVPSTELASGTPSGNTCLLGNQTWGSCGAGGSSSYINSTLVANPNFNSSTPAPQSSFLNCSFQNSASNVSLQCPYGNTASTFALGSQAVLNNRANAYGSGLQDFSAASLKLPSGPGYAPGTAGAVGFDTTSNAAVINVNGVTQQVALTTSNISGQANTALALATTPAQCNGAFATGIQANGNANCSVADVLQLAETSQPAGLPNYGIFWFDSVTHTPRVIDNNGQMVQLALMNVFNSDANTLEEYNGTTPQTLNVYGTRADASDYERLRLGYDTPDGYFFVGAEAAGTGTQRGLGLWLQGGLRWVVDASFTLKPWSDNLKDIGTSTLRVRNLYLGTGLVFNNGTLNGVHGTTSVAAEAGTLGTTAGAGVCNDGNGNITDQGCTLGAVSSVFGRSGVVVPQTGDYSVAEVTGAAPLASPAFSGTPTAPTPAIGDNSTKIATTAWAQSNFNNYAELASPAFMGSPTAPTPSTSDSSTKIATTAWVNAQGFGTGGGNVSGPASSINSDLVSFNGANGKSIQDSGVSATGGTIIATNLKLKGPVPLIDVTNPAYGATGNGSTDDSAALNAAIAACPALGGAVLLPAGTYLLGSSAVGMTINQPCKIFSYGGEATIVKGFSSSVGSTVSGYGFVGGIQISASNVILRDLTINCGASNGYTGNCITDSTNNTDVLLRNLNVSNVDGHTVVIAGATQGGWGPVRFTIDGGTYIGGPHGDVIHGGQCLDQLTVQNTTKLDGTANTSILGGSTLNLQAATTGSATCSINNVHVLNNHDIRAENDWAIQGGGANGLTSRDWQINGNSMKCYGPCSGLVSVNVTPVQINDNVLDCGYLCSYMGIEVASSTGGTFDNNVILAESLGSSGAAIFDTTDDVAAVGNSVYGCGQNGADCVDFFGGPTAEAPQPIASFSGPSNGLVTVTVSNGSQCTAGQLCPWVDPGAEIAICDTTPTPWNCTNSGATSPLGTYTVEDANYSRSGQTFSYYSPNAGPVVCPTGHTCVVAVAVSGNKWSGGTIRMAKGIPLTGNTTTVGTTAAGTSVVVASATGFAAPQMIAIPGAGASGTIYVGYVTGISGSTFTVSPATSTSVSAGTAVYNGGLHLAGSSAAVAVKSGSGNAYMYSNSFEDVTVIGSNLGQGEYCGRIASGSNPLLLNNTFAHMKCQDLANGFSDNGGINNNFILNEFANVTNPYGNVPLATDNVVDFQGQTLNVTNLTVNGTCTNCGAPLNSPAFTGTPTAPTPGAGDNSTRLATTAYVQGQTTGIPWLTVARGGSTSGVAFSTTANQAALWGVVLTFPVTTTQVTYYVGTGDNTSNTYDIGIYDNSGNLKAHIGATAGTTFAPTVGPRTVSWAGGAVTLQPGRYYLAITTNCTSSCAALDGDNTSAVTFQSRGIIAIASGGTLSGPITPPADAWNWASYTPAWVVR